jgi:hypothetical protein
MNLARAALRGRHRWIAGPSVLMVVALGLSATARAEPARRVVLVVPGAMGPIATEALTRVRGELQAARFEVVTEVVSADVDRRATVEREVRKGNARAAFGIFFGTGMAEIWVTDAVTGRTAVQMLPLDAAAPERRAAVLAVKAVDLLKATLAEIWIASPLPASSPPSPGPPAPTPAPASPTPTEPSVPSAHRSRSTDTGISTETGAVVAQGEEPEPPEPRLVSRFELAAGAAWIAAGSASSWAPLVSVSVFDGRIGGRLVASGFGSAVTVQAADIGSARFTQALGLAEVVVRQPFGRYFETTASLGAGGYLISAEGSGADSIHLGHSGNPWSPVVGGGVGAAITIRRLTIAFDARVLEATTTTVVRIAGDEVARVGRPLIWLGSSIGVRL